MAYLGSWKIDDYLTFYCNTHDPDTGVATDADSAPTYRVYEDETGTAILTGSMALLDSSNTAGFYSERIQLTAANGFEKGKQYAIYISATVDSDTGTMHHTFQIEAEVDANTVSDTVTPADGSITAAKIATDAITSDELAASAVADIADAVWDETSTGHTDAGKAGAQLWTDVDAILADTNELQTDLTDGGRLDLLIDAIKARTDNLPDDPADDSDIDTQLANIASDVTAILADTGTDGVELATSALADIADAVWDEALSGHTTAGTAGKTLSNTSTLGAGATTFTYTLTSTADGAAIADADVWVTTDAAGNNVVASGQTDGNGQVTFYLDAGTYYIWRQKAGWNFSNPDTETVS